MSVLLTGNIKGRATTYRFCSVCLATASEPGPDGKIPHKSTCMTRTHYWHKSERRWVKWGSTRGKKDNIKATKKLYGQSVKALERNAGELLQK